MDYWYVSSTFRSLLTGVTVGYRPSCAHRQRDARGREPRAGALAPAGGRHRRARAAELGEGRRDARRAQRALACTRAAGPLDLALFAFI